jgi:hypothetical protein
VARYNSNVTVYLGDVITRIPSYNANFEEPLYWDTYGADIFNFSYYRDKFNT